MDKNIKYFIYIDVEGINSIYCQCPNSTIPTKTVTTNYVGGTVDASIDATALRILSASVESKVDAKYKIQEEKQEKISVENKIESIINHISGGRIEILYDILKNNNSFSDDLIVCKSIFRFIQAYDEDNEQYVLQSDIAKNSLKYKNLSFNFCATPHLQNYSDNIDVLKYALEDGEYYVDMFFSGSKMTRGVRHLTNNIKYGKDFIMCVLGEITSEGHGIYCLKPYAIWRMTDRNT